MSKCRSFFVLFMIGILLLANDACAQVVTPGEMISRANSASSAAKRLQKLASIWNALGLTVQVKNEIDRLNDRIMNDLKKTGQAGVLVAIEIERIDHETPVYYLVGDQARYYGAGSTPEDVHFAQLQLPSISSALRPSAKFDLDRSVYLWFQRDNSSVIMRTVEARPLVVETARYISDRLLSKNLNELVRSKGLQAAVAFVEQTATNNEVRRQIAKLRQKQADFEAQIAAVDIKLRDELERARKASAVSAQLRTMASVFTLASQIASIRATMGSDTPQGIDGMNADQLDPAVRAVLGDANGKIEELRVNRGTYIDGRTNIRMDYIVILRRESYPIENVPQLNLTPSD